MKISLMLPYPPSANSYWYRSGKNIFINKKGREYRRTVSALLAYWRIPTFPRDAKVKVTVIAHPPDRRKRDIDNILKCLFDSLERGGVFYDDNQVEEMEVTRGDVVSGGLVEVTIEDINDSERNRQDVNDDKVSY